MSKKYLKEENWQKLRKYFLLAGILGIALIVVGITMFIITSTKKAPNLTVPKMGEENWFEITRQQSQLEYDTEVLKNNLNFAGGSCVMLGMAMSIAGFVGYFKRQLQGAYAQGVMPVATEAINKGAEQISPAIQTVIKGIESAKQGDKANTEELLAKAKSLRDRKLIDEDEYKAMRKNILNIK